MTEPFVIPDQPAIALTAWLLRLGACDNALRHVEGKTLAEAFETCPSAHWIIWLVLRAKGKRGIPRYLTVKARIASLDEQYTTSFAQINQDFTDQLINSKQYTDRLAALGTWYLALLKPFFVIRRKGNNV